MREKKLIIEDMSRIFEEIFCMSLFNFLAIAVYLFLSDMSSNYFKGCFTIIICVCSFKGLY